MTTLAGRLLAAAATALLISGCGTPIYADRYSWSDGWRDGKVVQVLQGSDVPYARWYRCLKDVSPEERSGRLYAQVIFRQGRYKREWLPVPKDVELHPGDAAYFNPYRCDADIVKH